MNIVSRESSERFTSDTVLCLFACFMLYVLCFMFYFLFFIFCLTHYRTSSLNSIGVTPTSVLRAVIQKNRFAKFERA